MAQMTSYGLLMRMKRFSIKDLGWSLMVQEADLHLKMLLQQHLQNNGNSEHILRAPRRLTLLFRNWRLKEAEVVLTPLTGFLRLVLL